MTSALERLRTAVQRDRTDTLTALSHHIYNVDHLYAAYLKLNRSAAAGVDGETWQAYGQDLAANLQALATRLRRGAYRAPPVRRVHLPKPDGGSRALGVPTLEDKLVQCVTAQLCSVIWEEEFLGFSYGFRPGRSAHDALDALTVGIERKRVNWVLDADIRGFFDTLSHEWLITFLQHRIGDQRIIDLIQQWLRAGVREAGVWTASEAGTPQGGLISPLAGNVYLHYVFDLWVQQWRHRHARGDIIVVRYADDIVVGFEHRAEAEQFQRELAERLARFQLALHPQKTRLIEFGRFAAEDRAKRGQGRPETFQFLGFTPICGTQRTGRYTVLRQTVPKRRRATLKRIARTLRERGGLPLAEQGRWLATVVLGHFRYYGVPKNGRAVAEFRDQVIRLWRHALGRRSQRGRISWQRIYRLAERWLPQPRIYHPYPSERLIVRTGGKSRMR